MYVEMYRMRYGNFKFMAELDTGAEVGENQLSLWCCERADIHTIPLEQIEIPLLLKALKEPQRSLLLPSLEEVKRNEKLQLEQQISDLQQLASGGHKQNAHKMSSKNRAQIKRLRKDITKLLRQIEQKFVRDEILSLELDCFNLDLIADECEIFGEWRFLRAFYFEEANEKTIQNFCTEFANSEHYRQQVRKGELHWIRRNALFTRNLIAVLGEHTLLADDGSAMRRTRELFRWFDMHAEAIMAQPAYQQLLQQDLTARDNPNAPDPQLHVSIDIFTQMPGVKVHLSCQGVSGRVQYQEYELLAITYHEAYAYIAFTSISYFVHDSIIANLAEYPAISIERIPGNFALCCLLRSTGDNLRFREEVQHLAQRIHAAYQEQNVSRETSGKEETGTAQMDLLCGWKNTNQPAPCPPTEAPGGIQPGRKQWLCQPEHVESTLALLYHLNHWAKASDILFYSDRQGLYRIKAALIEEAYRQGRMIPIGYIDGRQSFVESLHLDMAASVAPEVLNCWLDDSLTDTDRRGQLALSLFQRISGQAYRGTEDDNKIIADHAESYIREALQTLIAQAYNNRQPLAPQDLEALLIFPDDILELPYSRSHYISDWSDLNEDDLRQLDPEGWSLVSIEYRSETAHYIFHLPYRIAEKFVAADQLASIHAQASESREVGTLYGRALTKEESEFYPIEEILKELQVHIASVCPKKLERKTERIPYHRYSYDWCDCEDDDEYEDDWDPEDLDELLTIKKSTHRKKKKPQQQHNENDCPLCEASIEAEAQNRVEHWQQEHQGQDLTIRKVHWLLCTDDKTFKQLHIAPDYREDDKPDGTRYWKLATLAKVAELLGDELQNEPLQEQPS